MTVSNNGSSDGQRINIYSTSGVALVTQMREGLQAVTSSRKICNELRPLLKKLMLLKFSNKCLNVERKSESKVIKKKLLLLFKPIFEVIFFIDSHSSYVALMSV